MAEKKSEAVVWDTKRRKYSAEEKITIVLEGLRGEESISAIAGVKASRQTSSTAGAKTSWRQARSGSWAIL